MFVNQTALLLPVAEDGNHVTAVFPADTELTEASAEDLHHELLALVAGRERPHLTVDLAGVTILTSVGLAKFLAVHKHLRAAGGHLTLLNPTATVRTVFAVTRLDTVLYIQPTVTVLPARD